ncbi:MAG: SAF domain-containing protein [Acidimicrobiales bacterium]|nr:SAF domain-containing protein [Acidimicrobiales bacterium]
MVGGLLVTGAMVAVFAATTGAGSAPSREAVVARSAIPAGHRLAPSDLTTRPVELPAGTAAAVFASADELVGAVTIAPLETDELVQRSAVVTDGRTRAPAHEFSFPVERERALDGKLQRGESVAILATFGSGPDAYTSVLAPDATVIDVESGGAGTIGSGATLVLTVALGSGDVVLDVAHAAQVADLTIVRATTAGDAPIRDRAGPPAADATGGGVGS